MLKQLAEILRKKYPSFIIHYWVVVEEHIRIHSCLYIDLVIYQDRIILLEDCFILYITPHHPNYFDEIDLIINKC